MEENKINTTQENRQIPETKLGKKVIDKKKVSKTKKRGKSGLVMFIFSLTLLFSLTIGTVGGVAGYFFAQEFLEDENESTEVILETDNDTNRIARTVNVLEEDSAIIDVAETASDSVVSIVVTGEVRDSFFGFRTGREAQIGAGSGFIISEEGMIITNRHVVSNPDASYTVVFNDGSSMDAEVLARDTLLDIAFLQIQDLDKDLEPLNLGTSENIRVGQRAIAIGNALGEFSNSVSAGIISGLGRDIIAGDRFGRNTETITNVIQTDASINPGNSGGPLLDIEGNVIGVNVAVAANSENIGFAIPIDDVKNLLERLNEEGEIERPILGIRYLSVNRAIQRELDLEVDYGALIIEGQNNEPGVLEGSPATEVGLEVGDIIIEIDGIQLDGEENSLQSIIQQKYIGDKVELRVLKANGDEEVLEVELFKF